MTQYETLRETRNKMLFPDGVPLEFGCEVKVPTRENIARVVHKEKMLDDKEAVNVVYPYDWSAELVYCDALEEILGKEVSIADILRMLHNNEYGYCFSLDIFGSIYDENRKVYATIDLSKPLSQQESVCKEINEILC